MNPKTDTVYVGNLGDDTLSVINAKTNTVVATVAVGSAPVAITANPKTNVVYVANSGDESVSVLACGA